LDSVLTLKAWRKTSYTNTVILGFVYITQQSLHAGAEFQMISQFNKELFGSIRICNKKKPFSNVV